MRIGRYGIVSCLIGFFIVCCGGANLKDRSGETGLGKNQRILTDSVKIPSGRELKIEISEKSMSVLVTVRNESGSEVFVPFAPESKSRITKLVFYHLEKSDSNGNFREYGIAGHYVPPLHSIAPRESMQFEVKFSEKGEYRILLAYFVDPYIVSRLNERFTKQQLSREEEGLIPLTQATVISETFKL